MKLLDLPGWNKKMATKSLARKLAVLLLVPFLHLVGGCDGGLRSNCINCPVSTGNRSTNDILFVTILSGETKSRFGFLDSTETGFNKTTIGCDIEMSPNTTIEWEENDKKCSAIVDMSMYEPKKHEIKSLGFLYKGNGVWEVIARSGIFDDSPEVKP